MLMSYDEHGYKMMNTCCTYPYLYVIDVVWCNQQQNHARNEGILWFKLVIGDFSLLYVMNMINHDYGMFRNNIMMMII